jgi:hypothetical protein
METKTVVLIAIIVVAAAAVFLVMMQRRGTRDLKRKFGPEYDRAVRQHGNPHRGEAELKLREKRVSQFPLRNLTTEERGRFAADWRLVQERFVDSPRAAVAQADRLVDDLLRARGFPLGGFEQKAADLSVDHATVVENYRIAHEIASRDVRGAVSTEDLREAMQRYRSIFEDLLGTSVVHYPEVQHHGD